MLQKGVVEYSLRHCNDMTTGRWDLDLSQKKLSKCIARERGGSSMGPFRACIVAMR